MPAATTLRERLVGTIAHDLLGVWMLVWSYLPAVAALAVFHRYPNAGTLAFAFVMVGLRMHALFVVTHEAWHYNLFRSRWLNDWAGALLASYPAVMPYFQDRNGHWDHHRYVGTSKDPDAWAWDFRDDQRGTVLKELFLLLSGFTYAARIARLVLRLPAPPPPPGRPARTTMGGKGALKELARLAAVHLVILGVFAATIGWYWYFPLWALPALTVFPMVHMLREFLEHRRGALIIYQTDPLQRFVFGCFNFHLHAYHHAHASAPWFTLPAMKERALAKQPGIVFLRSYLAELWRYFRGTSKVPAPADHEAFAAGDVPLQERLSA